MKFLVETLLSHDNNITLFFDRDRFFHFLDCIHRSIINNLLWFVIRFGLVGDIFWVELVSKSFHFFDDVRFTFEGVEPKGVRYVWSGSAVSFREIFGRNVFVQRFHVVSVEEDLLSHAVVQQWLEHGVDSIEDPGLVDDVEGVSLDRKACLKMVNIK